MITIRNRRKSFITNKNSISNRTFFHAHQIESFLSTGGPVVAAFLWPTASSLLIANLAIRNHRNSRNFIYIEISNTKFPHFFPCLPAPRNPTVIATLGLLKVPSEVEGPKGLLSQLTIYELRITAFLIVTSRY